MNVVKKTGPQAQVIYKILLFIVLVSLLILARYYRHYFEIATLEQTIQNLGVWAPMGFILIYAVGTVLFLPGLVMTIMGGFVFGIYWGACYSLLGAVMGASLSFLISRYLAGDWVAARLSGQLQQWVDGVSREGWKFVALIRLIPLFPFNVSNYAFGLTKIHFGTYVLASTIFMLPGVIAYSYVGSLGRTVLAGDMQQIISNSFLAIGVLVVLAIMTRQLRKRRGL